MALSVQEQMLIEQRVTNESSSTGAAYLLWFFLGFFSAHRFYLGRPGTAILQIVLNCLLVGLIWTLIDAFLIPGMIRRQREELRRRYGMSALTGHMAGDFVDARHWQGQDRVQLNQQLTQRR